MQEDSEGAAPLGVNRRHVLQAAAAGVATSGAGGPPAAAQPKQNPSGTVAVATPDDYVRDPTRWGSPEIAALFPGFTHMDMRTSGAVPTGNGAGIGCNSALIHSSSAALQRTSNGIGGGSSIT